MRSPDITTGTSIDSIDPPQPVDEMIRMGKVLQLIPLYLTSSSFGSVYLEAFIRYQKQLENKTEIVFIRKRFYQKQFHILYRHALEISDVRSMQMLTKDFLSIDFQKSYSIRKSHLRSGYTLKYFKPKPYEMFIRDLVTSYNQDKSDCLTRCIHTLFKKIEYIKWGNRPKGILIDIFKRMQNTNTALFEILTEKEISCCLRDSKLAVFLIPFANLNKERSLMRQISWALMKDDEMTETALLTALSVCFYHNKFREAEIFYLKNPLISELTKKKIQIDGLNLALQFRCDPAIDYFLSQQPKRKQYIYSAMINKQLGDKKSLEMGWCQIKQFKNINGQEFSQLNKLFLPYFQAAFYTNNWDSLYTFINQFNKKKTKQLWYSYLFAFLCKFKPVGWLKQARLSLKEALNLPCTNEPYIYIVMGIKQIKNELHEQAFLNILLKNISITSICSNEELQLLKQILESFVNASYFNQLLFLVSNRVSRYKDESLKLKFLVSVFQRKQIVNRLSKNQTEKEFINFILQFINDFLSKSKSKKIFLYWLRDTPQFRKNPIFFHLTKEMYSTEERIAIEVKIINHHIKAGEEYKCVL